MSNCQTVTDDDGNYIGQRFKCRCGSWLESYMGHDTDCSRCGRLFNSVGQELNHPNQWSENHDY